MLAGIIFLLFAVVSLAAVLWYVVGDQYAIVTEARLTRKQLDAWFSQLAFSHKVGDLDLLHGESPFLLSSHVSVTCAGCESAVVAVAIDVALSWATAARQSPGMRL